MYLIALLFLCIFPNALQAMPSHEEFVDSIMKAARKSLSVEEEAAKRNLSSKETEESQTMLKAVVKSNIVTLRELVYEQNFSNVQRAPVTHRRDQSPSLVSALTNFFSLKNSGAEIPEEDRERNRFFDYLVSLYAEFPLVRIGYNNPREFDRSKGYVTLCFFIQKEYHHAGLVFEYPGLLWGVNAELFHLAYGEESGSGDKGKKVYRIRREGKEKIINRLIWSKNNNSGDDERPDRSILKWYPYATFEVDLKKMYKALSKAGWSALLEKEHSYNRMGLISHNCCTYVAELLEIMGVNLEYRRSYKLFFTDEDLRRLVDRHFYWNSERKYKVQFTEYDRENKDALPFAYANRNNLYRVLKVKDDIEEEKARQKAEKNRRIEEEKARKEAEEKRRIEEKREAERKKIEEAKISFKLKSFIWKSIRYFRQTWTYVTSWRGSPNKSDQ